MLYRQFNSNNCNCESDTDRQDPRICKQPETKLFLECGLNPQDAIFEVDDGRIEDNQCFVLNRVLVDTSRLIKPLVKIEFSSLVVFEAEDEEGPEHEVEVDLLFKLIRSCNGHSEVIQTWRYLYEIDVENCINELEVEISESFTFTFCDRICPDCCEYRVEVEGKDFEGEFEFLRVSRPELSAIVQGECCD